MTKENHKLADLPPAVRAAINRYVEAKPTNAWKGTMDPADWPEVERELSDARENMVRVLKAHLKG